MMDVCTCLNIVLKKALNLVKSALLSLKVILIVVKMM